MKETVNQRIARLRKLRGLTQAEMAEKLGMKSSTYSQMERTGNITTQRLIDIANILKVRVSDLLYDDPEAFSAPIVLNSAPVVEQMGFATERVEPKIDLILTQKEEMLVKIYRQFDKEQKAEIDKVINDMYKIFKEEKRKKAGKK